MRSASETFSTPLPSSATLHGIQRDIRVEADLHDYLIWFNRYLFNKRRQINGLGWYKG